MKDLSSGFYAFGPEFREPLEPEMVLWLLDRVDHRLYQFAVEEWSLESTDWDDGARYRWVWEDYLYLPEGIIRNPQSFQVSEADRILETWSDWFLEGGWEDVEGGRCIYSVLVREETVPVEFDGDFDFADYTKFYLDLWAYLQLCLLFRRRELVADTSFSNDLTGQCLCKDIFKRELFPSVEPRDQFYTGFDILLYWLTVEVKQNH